MLIFLTYYLILVNSFLDGLWVCDDDFCIESGINQMIFYMGECKYLYKRKACLIMLDSDNIPHQFCFELVYNPFLKRMTIISDEETILPNNLNMELSINDGTILLYDSEKEYARLYKDNINNVPIY